MDDGDAEEGAFDVQQIQAICSKVLKNQLPSDPTCAFVHSKVEQNVSVICENVLKDLAGINDANDKKGLQIFKYVVTAHVQQKSGAGLSTGTTAYWDKQIDGYAVTRWENETTQAVVTVFGVGL
jgi:hypothetical protein